MTSLLLLLLAVQDPGPVLDRASASFDTVRTLQANFVQIIDNPMLGDPDTTRGKLFQLRPNYFAMRFTEPKNDRIVADGRRLWLYTPSTTPGQVIRTAIPGTGTTGPNLIGQFVERPRPSLPSSHPSPVFASARAPRARAPGTASRHPPPAIADAGRSSRYHRGR